MSKTTIRRLGRSDVVQLTALCKLYAPAARSYAAFELAHAETFRWIGAFAAGSRLIGAQRIVFWEEFAFLRTVLVKREARGHGLGTRLIEAALRDAAREGKSAAFCWSWDLGGEREMLARRLELQPCSRRYVRFRVPARTQRHLTLAARTATDRDLSALRRFPAIRSCEVPLPRSVAAWDVDCRAGYAVLETERENVCGGFFFVREHSCLSVLCPAASKSVALLDIVTAASAWAHRLRLPSIDIPVDAHDFVAWMNLRQLGGVCLHAHPVGLSCRALRGARTGRKVRGRRENRGPQPNIDRAEYK